MNKIICTICARKGSSGLKNKNILKINNKKLIEYTIDIAIKSKIFDHIALSSDIKFSEQFKRKYRDIYFYNRPKKLSGPKIGKVEVIRDLLISAENKTKTNFEFIYDLDVTSPLRSLSDIKKSINKFIKNRNSTNLVSVTPAHKNPYFNLLVLKNNKLELLKKTNKNYLSRQTSPKVFEMNASIYIWRRKYLLKTDKIIDRNTIYYEMPRQKSIDIDDKFDFFIVKTLIEKNNKL